jgi:DNA-binding response OmpR family regulator
MMEHLSGGKKILVVENDRVLSRILTHSLTQAGFAVSDARNGIEGIEQAEASTPDLILVDVDMPKMDGITMLKELRAKGNTTPIIILTNYDNPELIADATEYGANQYLIKADWEIDEVAEKVKKVLGQA